MKCPYCPNEKLSVWWWQDGGAKGVCCYSCDKEWWSDSLSSKIHDASNKAADEVMTNEQFPEDASEAPPWGENGDGYGDNHDLE